MDSVSLNNPLLKKFSSLLELTEEETQLLGQMQNVIEEIPADTDLVLQGEELAPTYIVKEGWAYNYKILIDGRQQILAYLIPGDFIGLFSIVSKQAEYSVRALTDLQVCRIDSDRIIELFQSSPRLALALCWSVAREGELLVEQVMRIGRRTAYERTAHLLLEILRRLTVIDLADSAAFEFPVSQQLLADTLGLTPVHVNRTLRTLQKDGMIEYSGDRILIKRQTRLRELVDFDPSYIDDPVKPVDLDIE